MLSTNPHKRRCHAYLPETQHRVKYVNREGTAFLFIQVNYYVFSFLGKPRSLGHYKETVQQSFHCLSPKVNISA